LLFLLDIYRASEQNSTYKEIRILIVVPKDMNISEEIEKLWKIFDEGYKHSNEIMLIERIFHLLSLQESDHNQDLVMYRQFLSLINDGGFLIKEEKRFLINYFILLMNKMQTLTSGSGISEQLRDCTSILDVWPEKQGVRVNYTSGTYRKESIVWIIRMYEVLGNNFLHKRGHVGSYNDMELAIILKEEKCKLSESDYPLLKTFLRRSASFLKGEETALSDLESGLKVMRKLIWKIKEGITKYS